MMLFLRLVLALVVCLGVVQSASKVVEVGSEWKVCRSTADEMGDDCVQNAIVPGTVLTNLLKNGTFSGLGSAGIYLDNVYTDNNLALLPDIAETGPEFYEFWWSTKLDMIPAVRSGGKAILQLAGINYRARVVVDGQELQPMDGKEPVGMFQSLDYDISSFAQDGKQPQLAILVSPPDYPGIAGTAGGSSGQGGDHLIANNGPVAQFSAGWDWCQATPDRMTGIWDRVSVKVIDSPITLLEPHAILDELALEEGDGNHADASFTISANVRGVVESEFVNVRAEVLDSVTGTVLVTGQASTKGNAVSVALQLPAAQLWWPHTQGQPYLYQVRLTVMNPSEDTSEGDQISFSYGFRQIEMYIDSVTQGWGAKVNGRKVFLQGGNWITTDQLLRDASGSGLGSRYDNEVALHADMGMNLIRVWGGGLAERAGFYQACDERGVLVFQEFWMTGDNNGRWGGEYSYPKSDEVYLANARSTITTLRNHPSLLLWCMGNELFPFEENPKPSIHQGLESLLTDLDPQRFHTSSSMSTQNPDPGGFDPQQALAVNDGPYTVLFNSQFYKERNPGMKGFNATPLSFQPEIGSVGTPELASLQRFLSPDHLKAFPTQYSKAIDSAWDYHKYESYNTDSSRSTNDDDAVDQWDNIYEGFDATVSETHGLGAPVRDTADYAWRAQIVQYAQYKSLFEGFNAHAWEYYTAVLMWKSASPWPALRGGLYDWYMRQTGGYWGARNALAVKDTGLHVQMDAPVKTKETCDGCFGSSSTDTTIRVVNKGNLAFEPNKLFVQISFFDGSGKKLGITTKWVPKIDPYSAVVVAEGPGSDDGTVWPAVDKGLRFARMQLLSADTTICYSVNEYWNDNSHLLELRDNQHNPTVAVSNCVVADGTYTCDIKNESPARSSQNAMAFMVRLNMLYSEEETNVDSTVDVDRRVLPVFYSKNYFSLGIGETKSVSMTTTADVAGKGLVLEVDGWNVAAVQHKIQ